MAPAGGAFGGLELFPAEVLRFAVVGVIAIYLAEDVRMTGFQLVRDCRGDVGESERTLFLGHARMKHDLEQEIAEFAAERIAIVTLDRIGDFVGFLDGIGRDRRESLRTVPFAARDRVPEPGHDAEEAVERIGHVRMIIYIMLNNAADLLPLQVASTLNIRAS